MNERKVIQGNPTPAQTGMSGMSAMAFPAEPTSYDYLKWNSTDYMLVSVGNKIIIGTA